MEDRFQRQQAFNRPVRILDLPAALPPSARRGAPPFQDLFANQDRDLAALHQTVVVRGPIAHAIARFLCAFVRPFAAFRVSFFLCHAHSLTQAHSFNKAEVLPENPRQDVIEQIRAMELASATAVWFHYGKPPVPIRWVLIRDPQSEYETVCLLCTDQTIAPLQIVEWFVRRWQVEVTFEEARRHLGIETQRQWSDKAIARTTPLLLGLFSWVTLVAHVFHSSGQPVMARQTIWYAKSLPTFSDALALVRFQLWAAFPTFHTSREPPDLIKVPHSFWVSLIETLCYAA